MKLTNHVVKQFEQDQQEHGTKTALFNFTWLIAADILKGIGVKKISTSAR